MTSYPARLLFRLSKAPYGSSYAREALDAAMAAAAFEQEVSLLFCGDGVYQLLPNQSPSAIHQKDFTAAFGLFPLYGLTRIYADRQSIEARKLAPEDLLLPVTLLDPDEIKSLLRRQDKLFSF